MSWHDIPTAVEAHATLASLERRRARLVARREEISGEREALAFLATAAGNKDAQKALDELTRQAARISLDIEYADFALAEARRRVAAAETEAGRAADRERAREARGRLVELRRAGAEASAALDAFVTSLERFRGIAEQLARLDVGAPRGELVKSNSRRAVQGHLARVGLGEFVAPADRVELSGLVETWAGRIEDRIAQMLGEEPAEAEAA